METGPLGTPLSGSVMNIEYHALNGDSSKSVNVSFSVPITLTHTARDIADDANAAFAKVCESLTA